MEAASLIHCASPIKQNGHNSTSNDGHNSTNNENDCPVKTSKILKETYERLYEKAERTLKKLENEGI